MNYSIQLNQAVALSATCYHVQTSAQRLINSSFFTKKSNFAQTVTSVKERVAKSWPIRSVLMAPGREFQSVDQVLVRIPAAAVVPDTKLCFLLVCDAFNTMAQRASLKLKESGHEVVVHVFKDGESMVGAVGDVNPDVILCPFLTKRIPAEVYKGPVPCLVIHPGIEGDRGMSSIDWALQESLPEWGVTILQAEQEMDAGPIWATR